MHRREFITLFGGTVIAWPLAARAQQTGPLIGIVSSSSASAYVKPMDAFREGLRETDYIDGQNVTIESRWAEGRFERLPGLVADLVQRRVAIIVTTGASSTLAVKAANPTTPHLFLTQEDPVKLGVVASFNRPGGNATGLSLLQGRW